MTTYQILYWHDIPSQVRARGTERRASVQLPQRFQDAIDAAAMAAHQIDSEDYAAGFHWSSAQERTGTAQQVAEAVAADIAAQYPSIDWRKTANRLKSQAAE